MSEELGLTGRVDVFPRSGTMKVIIFGNVAGGQGARGRRGIVHTAGIRSDSPEVLEENAARARAALLALGIPEEPES